MSDEELWGEGWRQGHADALSNLKRDEKQALADRQEIERLRGIIEEQRLTIGALNMKLGGATTLENLRAADQPSARLYPGCMDNDTGYHRVNLDGICSDCETRLTDPTSVTL